MNNYLLDRETLGKFVDELMKQKPLNVQNPEELEAMREKEMAALDKKVGEAVFGALNQEQLAEIDALIENEAESTAYAEFFEKYNINIEKIMEEAFRAYGEEFLGGNNE